MRVTRMARRNPRKGYSIIEIVVVVAIAMVLVAISFPLLQGAMRTYRLNAAASAVSMAVQTTRYQAIMAGYPYRITFDPGTAAYQVSRRPGSSASFVNVGSPVPLPGGSGLTIGQPTTLEFRPNGMVVNVTGSLDLSISYGGQAKTISVSRLGNVQVTNASTGTNNGGV